MQDVRIALMMLTNFLHGRRLSTLNKAYAASKPTADARRALVKYIQHEKEVYEGEPARLFIWLDMNSLWCCNSVFATGKEYHPFEVDMLCNRTPASWTDIMDQSTKDDIAEQILQDLAKENNTDVKVKIEKVVKGDKCNGPLQEKTTRAASRPPVYNTNYTQEDVLNMFSGSQGKAVRRGDQDAKVRAGQKTDGSGGKKRTKGTGQDGQDEDDDGQEEEEFILRSDEEDEDGDEEAEAAMNKEMANSDSDADRTDISDMVQEEDGPSRRPTKQQAPGKGQPQSRKDSNTRKEPQTTAVEKGGWKSPRKRKEKDNGKDNEKGTGKGKEGGRDSGMYDRRACFQVLARPPTAKRF